MPVSSSDLKRILKAGYRLEHFSVKTKEGWRLKNRSGRCVFLLKTGCGIYSHRPDGCRLYPLVYDENQKRAMIDSHCPYGHEFKVQKNDVKTLENLFRSLFGPKI